MAVGSARAFFVNRTARNSGKGRENDSRWLIEHKTSIIRSSKEVRYGVRFMADSGRDTKAGGHDSAIKDFILVAGEETVFH